MAYMTDQAGPGKKVPAAPVEPVAPQQDAAPVKGGPAQAEGLVSALEQFVTGVISEQLTAMLDSADEILFEMAEQAGNSVEQRLYLDTLRIIRIERARLLHTFQDNLKHSFADGRIERAAANIDLDDLDSWSVQGTDETEETVAVSNLESKAAALYQHELFELENRLETLAERSSETVSPKIVSPHRIFDAFRHTIKGLEVEFPIKRVIYRLAERSLLGNLGQVYSGANQMLASRGFEPHPLRVQKNQNPYTSPGGVGGGQQSSPGADAGMPAAGYGAPMSGDGYPVGTPMPSGGASFDAGPQSIQQGNWAGSPAGAPSPASQGTWAGADAGGMPGAAASIAWPSGMNPSRLLDALAQVGAPATAQVPVQPAYSDSQLAGDMAAALDALAQGRQINTWIPPANLALAGQMFDTLYQDHRLHDSFRPLLRRLQYPVMKTALSDPSFFTSPSHPVRNLVHDVFGMVSSLDSPSEQDIKRLTDLIEHLTRQFEVDAERLSIPEARAPSVDEAQAESFLVEQKQRMADHRARTLKMVRRLVAQELKIRTVDRDLPDTLMPLLLSGFGPMLAVNALRGGVTGTPWKESIDLLDRMLDSVSPHGPVPNERHLAEQADIIINITERLSAIGLAPEKIQRLVAALVDYYDELAQTRGRPAQRGAAKPAATAQSEAARQARAIAEARQALGSILAVGSWFQVWDQTNNQQRWLKLHAYFPTIDAVVFDDFMGENHLKLNASTLIRDFIKGLSAPVDPNAAVQRALKMLEPLADVLPPASEAPVWQPATETMH